MGVKPVSGMVISYIGEFFEGDNFYLEPGQLALIKDSGSLRQIWWYRCPCGNGGVLNDHIVHSTNPVDISPSLICPGGCHYFIKNGAIA